MSGHSKWAQIKRKKGVADVKRGTEFSKLAKAITVAARLGKNLEIAVAAARAANMPKDNIERAIQRGTGTGPDTQAIEEVVYEAYGPGGAAILITTLTDNRNRTINELRGLGHKQNFRLAEAGAVQYLFERRGIVEVEPGRDPDATQLELIDAGVTELVNEGDRLVGYTEPGRLTEVLALSERRSIPIASSRLGFIPKTLVPLSAENQRRLVAALEAIDELADVANVETNAQLDQT